MVLKPCETAAAPEIGLALSTTSVFLNEQNLKTSLKDCTELQHLSHFRYIVYGGLSS